jgi:hypothetical protein
MFREHNLGCRHAVSSPITWFFEQEPEPYCAELLSASAMINASWRAALADFYDDTTKLYPEFVDCNFFKSVPPLVPECACEA